MKILKNITVRKMLLIILTIFTLIWGIATGLTLKNFSETRILLENSEQQKAAYALLVKGNDQYFRSVTRMLRAMDYQQDNKAEQRKHLLMLKRHSKSARTCSHSSAKRSMWMFPLNCLMQ